MRRAHLQASRAHPRPLGRRAHDEPQARVVVAEVGRQVGAEVDARGVDEGLRALHRDAQAVADRLAAVCGDRVRGAHLVLGAGVEVADHGLHAVGVLGDVDELGGEAHPARVARLGVAAQERLEVLLRQVAVPPAGDAGVLPGQRAARPSVDPVDLLPVPGLVAAEARVPLRRRVVLRRRALAADLLGHAVQVEDLHRPRIDDVRLGQQRRRRVALDEQRGHAEIRQHHGAGQPAGAAADDQDSDLDALAHGGDLDERCARPQDEGVRQGRGEGGRSVAERVSVVLEHCAASSRPLTLTELAARTGLPKTTLHRVCWKLEELGLLNHSRRASRSPRACSRSAA